MITIEMRVKREETRKPAPDYDDVQKEKKVFVALGVAWRAVSLTFVLAENE